MQLVSCSMSEPRSPKQSHDISGPFFSQSVDQNCEFWCGTAFEYFPVVSISDLVSTFGLIESGDKGRSNLKDWQYISARKEAVIRRKVVVGE